MSPDQERRRHPRYALDLPVTLVLATAPSASFSGAMKDLSASGCFFEGELPSADFERVSLSFRRGLRAPVAAGRVVRRPSASGFAVCFESPGEDLQRLVSALGAITPSLRGDFVSSFLAPDVELS